jgi:hypothetical protein
LGLAGVGKLAKRVADFFEETAYQVISLEIATARGEIYRAPRLYLLLDGARARPMPGGHAKNLSIIPVLAKNPTPGAVFR